MGKHRTSQFNRYVGLARAANQLHLSRQRTIGLITSGHLRARLVDRSWWVDVRSLEALVRTRRRSRHVTATPLTERTSA